MPNTLIKYLYPFRTVLPTLSLQYWCYSVRVYIYIYIYIYIYMRVCSNTLY